MTEEINPNSRASFVDQSGRLSKYGMDTLRKVYRALQISGNSSIIDDIFNSRVDFASYREEPNIQTKTSSFSTLGMGVEIYEVTASCTVTLTQPEDFNLVIIFHNAGYTTITVTDGSNSDYLLVPNTVMPYQYFVEFGQWVP